MKRTTFATFSIFMLVLFVLSACTPSAPTQPVDQASEASTAPAAGEPVTLEYWVYSDFGMGAAGELQKTFIAEFEKAHPGVKINMTGKSDDELNNGMVTGAASGVLPDIYMNAEWAGALLTDLGVVANQKEKWDAMPESFRSQFNKDMVDLVTSEDGQTMHALPYTGTAVFMYRNLNVLKQAGIDPNDIPTTWDEWVEQSKKISEAGLYANPAYNLTYLDITPFYSGIGTTDEWGIDWPNKQTLIDPDKYTEMMKTMLALKPYQVDLGNGDQATLDLFLQNKLAYFTSGPWSDVPLREAKKAGKIDYDYILVPGKTAENPGGAGGIEAIYLSPNKNFDLAYEFAAYIADEPQMTRWAKLLNRFNSNEKTLAQIDDPLMDITKKSYDSILTFYTPAFVQQYPPQYYQILIDTTTAVMKGEMTPEEGTKVLLQKLNEAIAAEE